MSGPVTFGSSYQPPSEEGSPVEERPPRGVTPLHSSPMASEIAPVNRFSTLLSSPLLPSPSPIRVLQGGSAVGGATPSKEFVIKNLSPP